MGICRLGNLIRYFPIALIRGLTAGLGVIVFSLQVKDFFGLPIEEVPVQFVQKWILFCKHCTEIDYSATFMGIGTLASIFLLRKFFKNIPWGISAIILATIVSVALGLNIETIQSRFGDIPRMLPSPVWPSFEWDKIYTVIPDACAIALLGGIESLLSAVVGDNLTGKKHKSNTELMAQGIANLGSVLFGGIPATGTIARTATNVHAGAVSPISGMIHAVTLLLLMLFLSPVVGYIPMAALAAVLMVVAWNLGEPDHFIRFLRRPKLEVCVMLTTFSVIILANLLTGVISGMVVYGLGLAFEKWKSLAATK